MSLLVGCSTASPLVTSTLEPTTTPTPTDTPNPKANLPAYSEIIKTYPAGVELCTTEASLEGIAGNGSWLLNGDIQIKDNQMQVQCYGTKITVSMEGGDVIIDNVMYSKGALLTVDKDLNWIEVSSWE
jgi:hypothetical protein